MDNFDYSFVVIRHDFILGGTYSLTQRIFSWCYLNGIDTFWIKTKGMEISENIITSFRKLNTNIIDVKSINNSYYSDFQKIPYINFSSKNVVILSFDFNEYLIGENIRIKYSSVNIKNILYVVHPKIYEPLKLGIKTKLIENIFYIITKNLKKHYISQLLKNNSIIFMSDLDYQSCIKSLNIIPKYWNVNVVRLSMTIPPIDTKQIAEKFSSSSFNILSITRLDFPFKGYLIGLIDSFAILKVKYPKISLTIVGDGLGKNEIISKITKYNLQSDIFYIENVPYDEIDNYIKKAHLYVGMGTSILDASKFGVISITALAFQMGDKAIGFFHDNFEILGANFKEYKGDARSFQTLIEHVLNYSENEFINFSLKSYKIVDLDYNINSSMKQFFDFSDNIGLKSTLLYCHVSKIFNLLLFNIINIKKKLIKFFHKMKLIK